MQQNTDFFGHIIIYFFLPIQNNRSRVVTMYYSFYSLPLATATNKMAAEIWKNSLIASSLQLYM